ncbi:aminotransferase class V-fold PLP-dependent enzyme [Tetragenococcus koreensis]|uniref:cysteine desulfurase n=1 Tax=Enterococcus dongliensis TaxID=2559925 RepID=A0AAW8TIC8_9ENTE|nr:MULTISPECIES: aminotransferase class V-fold PLP-dependent enzyme [Enterococcaceae]MDN6640148.1 aminotransferase class V-fold PLP-dependent enzyme [Tetragenococcus sp.]MDN6834730.1 aminotransferase class V-fold PLP-dependent enzyme [Lactococcus lactis]MDN6839651.1 aminotransferase class V-fold PLP-dependent enzyme [Tetragenococcus halophilus]MCF1586179.1 aminotransferase class V-fold PLP-dependent enzyme [Tetragenococcus koreensis]MCF1615761.1 aminotransferase class V-fold PLP-dependent enzy
MGIYLDNAATTAQKPASVAEAVAHILQGAYGNPSRGAHGYSLAGFRVAETARKKIKDLFKADHHYEVAFTNNATVALNEVLKGLIQPGDHVITTDWEHNSVLRPLYQLEAQGASFDVVTSEAVTGRLDYEQFTQKIRPETKAVICNHASNVTGNRLDLEWVKDFCDKQGVYLIIDASQTAGVVPIDLSDGKVAAVCFTGHKSLYGPQGTGGVCLQKNLPIEPVITGGDGMQSFSKVQPKELPTLLEAGTLNIPGLAGLAAGIQWVQEQHSEIDLGSYFYQELQKIAGVTIYGDFTSPRVAVFSINIKDAESAVVSELLWEDYQIATRPGYHCAPLMHEALGTADRGTVRLSLSSFTTKAEIDQVLEALQELASR